MAEIMVSDRPLRVIVNGVDAVFHPGKEQPVRDALVAAAQAQGARIVGKAKAAPVSEPEPAKPTDEAIRAAIQHLMEDHDTKAFGADGSPKVRSIEKVLGANIDAADRDRVWEAMTDDG